MEAALGAHTAAVLYVGTKIGMAARDVHNVLIGASLCTIGLFVTYIWAPETSGISLTQRNGGGSGVGRAACDFPSSWWRAPGRTI